jgi:hypothetical protein
MMWMKTTEARRATCAPQPVYRGLHRAHRFTGMLRRVSACSWCCRMLVGRAATHWPQPSLQSIVHDRGRLRIRAIIGSQCVGNGNDRCCRAKAPEMLAGEGADSRDASCRTSGNETSGSALRVCGHGCSIGVLHDRRTQALWCGSDHDELSSQM